MKESSQRGTRSGKLGIPLAILFFFLMLPLVCYSADKIYLRSGQQFECKVIAIDTSTVTADILPNGIRRTFYKYEIKVIIYENGDAETFDVSKPSPSIETEKRLGDVEKKSQELEVKSSKSSGIATGVAICVTIFLVLLII